MARPKKEGLDYFPKDTGSFSDRKIRRLMNEFGAKGYTIFDCVLCQIYSDKGYYTKRDSEFDFDIADTLCDGITENLVCEVINGCLRIGLFNKELFDKYSVLTSSGIQKRYVLAKKTGVIMESMRVNSDETPVNSEESTQSKVKKSKVKESKEEYCENVFLKSDEYEKLRIEFGDELKAALSELSNYKLRSGKEYVSDYHALIGWVKDKLIKEKNSAKKESYGNNQKRGVEIVTGEKQYGQL